MAENTKIEWANHTFNPWYGCQRVGPGCDNCYAEGWAKRSGLVEWGSGAERHRTRDSYWRKPLTWNANAERQGIRYRVFSASLADVFDNAVPASWRADLFQLIERTPHLDWLLVTKRVGNVAAMMAEVAQRLFWLDLLDEPRLPSNVWLGITVVNQQEADRDIPKLLSLPAAIRFLSMEPLLGPVKLTDIPVPAKDGASPARINALRTMDDMLRPRIDWVITGGESGPGSRPMHPEWAQSLRDQCEAEGVPFLFKQWGEWVPMMGHAEGVPVNGKKHTFPDGTIMGRAGKSTAGRLLNGIEHNGFPEAS